MFKKFIKDFNNFRNSCWSILWYFYFIKKNLEIIALHTIENSLYEMMQTKPAELD